MTSLKSLRSEIRDKINLLRSIQRIVCHEDFDIAWAIASNEEEVIKLINSANKKGIEKWVDNQLQKSYETMPLRDLRLIARKKHIPYYNNLPKASLLSEITKYDNNRSNQKSPSGNAK